MGNEVVSIIEFPGHSGLHVEVVGLGLERNLNFYFAFFAHFEDAGFGAEFGEHGVSVFESDGSAHFGVFGGEVVFPDDVGGAFFVFAGVFG